MTKNRPSVLVVDDKANMLRLMTKVLHDEARVFTAANGAGAIAVLDEEAIDVVLCDLRMPDLSGLEVLRACKVRQPRAEFILMTAYATVDTAVTALKEGAYDYLTKPFEPEDAKAIVRRALHSARPRLGVAEEDELLPAVHARSRVMRELATIVRQIAPTEINVLVVGESGSGKQQIARAVHALSTRSERPFAALDCRGGPEESLASKLESMHGGTLCLENVDALDEAGQARLVQALELRGPAAGGARLRLVATTEQDLDDLVCAGGFRRDLSVQLRVATINVPPLRNRRADVPVLAAHLLAEVDLPRDRKTDLAFSAGAMERLVASQWPGNVRELRSVVEHAAALASDGRIGLEALPEWVRADASVEAPWDTLTWADALARGRADVARQYLVALLKRFDGDVVKAAARAAVERESFYRLLRRHGIQPESFRGDPRDEV